MAFWPETFTTGESQEVTTSEVAFPSLSEMWYPMSTYEMETSPA